MLCAVNFSIMTLVEKESKKELAILMSYKPENVNLEIFEPELQRLGYSKMLKFYGEIVEQELFNEVQSRESVSWLIEYISWHIKTRLFS